MFKMTNPTGAVSTPSATEDCPSYPPVFASGDWREPPPGLTVSELQSMIRAVGWRGTVQADQVPKSASPFQVLGLDPQGVAGPAGGGVLHSKGI